MATITGSSIIDSAQTAIQDATGIRWPRAELLTYLNDGQREAVLVRPEASVSNASIALTSGKTKQAIPSNAIALIDIVRNMGVDGSVAGRAIRIVSRDVLDTVTPEWHTATNALGYVQHYTYDPRDPKTFYTYPKAPASAWFVEAIFSVSPTNTADNQSTVIGIDDVFANALFDYVLYRAYSKDAEFSQNGPLAVAHYQAFANSLSVKTLNDAQRNPNIAAAPFNPNVTGGAKV